MSIEDRGGHLTVWAAVFGVFGAAAGCVWQVAVGADSKVPMWWTYPLGGIALVALYMCLAVLMKWWPYARSIDESLTGVLEPQSPSPTVPVAEAVPARLLTAPTTVQLSLETYAATNEEPAQQLDIESESAPALGAKPLVTDHWCHTTDGGKVPAVMNLAHTVMSHPAYMGQQFREKPSVKIGMLVGCEQIDSSFSGSALRAKFLRFLDSPTMRVLVGSLTHVPRDASWKSLAGHGALSLEAALTASSDPLEGVPVASVLFLPPTETVLYGRVERMATLILYIQPQAADGQVPPASRLVTWYRNVSLALTAPAAFAEFLSQGLGLATFGDRPAQFGIWLESQQPLTCMVDTNGLRTLPGSSLSNQFTGYAYADPDGKSADEVARALMVQMAEYTLHLDDFESALPDDFA